jgi:hypothetical protein
MQRTLLYAVDPTEYCRSSRSTLASIVQPMMNDQSMRPTVWIIGRQSARGFLHLWPEWISMEYEATHLTPPNSEICNSQVGNIMFS